jgi:hypothetical protein
MVRRIARAQQRSSASRRPRYGQPRSHPERGHQRPHLPDAAAVVALTPGINDLADLAATRLTLALV